MISTLKSKNGDPHTPLKFEFKGPIYRAFREQAARAPQALAIVSGRGNYTYAAVDEISNRLATCLRARGIGPSQTVALFSDRNPALVCAMIGVLKAGASFFVADAAYPAARILDCASLAKPSLLLVCGEVVVPPEVEAAVTGAIFRLPSARDEALRTLAAFDSAAPMEVKEEHIAYLGFTSGSTGKPKGIATGHAPLPHFIDWHVRTHGFGPNDRFSLLSGLGHDPALRDIFTPLSIGAALHIPEQAVIFDPFQLSGWLAEQRITVLHLTPALGQIIFAGAQGGEPLASIRYFFWGGDVLSSKLSLRLREVAPNAKQVNFYGATETPQAMSYFAVDLAQERESYPIGAAIDDVQILIVTPDGKLAGTEEVGEIFVRTQYLSRGYLNDAEQTAAKYVPNPFTNDPSDRCYRTGDLGKYLEDGNVAFAGRNDHQVKIRGFRVELDEVISRIEQQAGITRAVVLAKDLGRESKVLVAYYTCDAGKLVKPDEVQEAVRKLLPAYMVPSYLMRLDQFPLLPNGKIDLRSLPAPTQETSAACGLAEDAPTSPRERELVEVWCAILGVKRVGIHDSFMDMGGDSLSAIQALVRMRRLGVPDRLARGVLQGKTIAQIVREEEEGPSAKPQAAPLSGGSRTSLMVNLLRAALVTIVVVDHWLPGLLKRLPSRFGDVEHFLAPFFNIATPGFAFVFGISLGYNYYPKFKDNPARLRSMLRFGQWLLGISVLLDAGLEIWATAVKPEAPPLTVLDIWGAPYGPLLYYFFALATVPLWFWFISRFRSEIVACLALLAAFYAAHRFIMRADQDLVLALNRELERTGFLQLFRLALVAKYAYFNMSIGALGGTAAGIYLLRQRGGSGLTGKLSMIGALLMLGGLALLYLDMHSLAGFYDEKNMGLWRWLFFAGVVLAMAAGVNALLGRYERMPAALRGFINWGSVLGQCCLLVFVLHGVVLHVKAVLAATGLAEKWAIAIPVFVFLAIVGWVMNKIHGLYYGSSKAN